MESGLQKKEIMAAMLKVLLITYLVTSFFLLIFALLLYKVHPMKNYLSAGMIVIYLVSNFLGGLMLGKKMKHRRAVWGVICGISYFLVLCIVSMIMNQSISLNPASAGVALLTCMAGGCLGGMVS